MGSVDNTSVTILPSQALPGGAGVPQAPANTATQININAGEVVQWLDGDPTGAILQSDQPIGVFTGSTYLRVATQDSSGGGQDSAHQQLPPINALGTTYVGGGVVTRKANLQPESVLYRIVGVVDGTQLTWSPMPAGAPTTLAAGEAVEFESADLFEVSSQDDDHPFALSQYLAGTSGSLDRDGCSPNPPFAGLGCGLGDEEWVVQLPPEQFLQRYVFFTDPTYGSTNLVVTRVRGDEGFEDVTIDCLGAITGWQPVGANGQYEVAHVDLIRGTNAVTPACATSRHEATSEGRFGVTVDGEEVDAATWGSRRARVLLKRLVVAEGRPVTRDELFDLLWPDETDRARLGSRLSVQLSAVRRVLGGGVVADRDTVALDHEVVSVDLVAYLAAVDAGDDREVIERFGEFLPEHRYDDWAHAMRERVRSSFTVAAHRVATAALDADEHERALDLGRRILDADPSDSLAHATVVDALEAMGDVAAADRQRAAWRDAAG
ncbi:MAG: hypothetical protein AAGG08_11830 [Actinomycetota bacterium]